MQPYPFPGAQWLEPPRRQDWNKLEQPGDSPEGTRWKQRPLRLSWGVGLTHLLTDGSYPDVLRMCSWGYAWDCINIRKKYTEVPLSDDKGKVLMWPCSPDWWPAWGIDMWVWRFYVLLSDPQRAAALNLHPAQEASPGPILAAPPTHSAVLTPSTELG